jgi:hypothetical protein
MNNARFNYVASGMRPQRKITSADHRSDGVICILECGHVFNGAPHFTYKVGSEQKCGACGQEAARKLPEFSNQ